MTTYMIHYRSGVTRKSTARTLAGAKRDATAGLVFGCGGVTIADADGERLAQRDFWERHHKWGWSAWHDFGGESTLTRASGDSSNAYL